MDEITFDAGIALSIDALHADRLALLAGAGLSMDPPSSLPHAARLAAEAKRIYDDTHGDTRPPLAADIETQAEFFYQNGGLWNYYLTTLIHPDSFASPPNPGHAAVADLLLVGGIRTAVTTNVDILIEAAGLELFGRIATGTDLQKIALHAADVSPLVKIHGCSNDPATMIWAPSQLTAPPFAQRIADLAGWLGPRLLNRHVLIVGYWTDWDYLNAILAATLGAVTPESVIVVNPGTGADLADKAPDLYALGERGTAFKHVRASGSQFLAALRMEFSRSFLRKVLRQGRESYLGATGNPCEPAWLEPATADNDALWQIRRDLEGRRPNHRAADRNPPNEPFLGMTLLKLQARGATAEGSHWRLNGESIRVIRAPNTFLHIIEGEFEGETAPINAPDVIIAVGAENHLLPASIVRAGTTPTIARGSASRWVTRDEAEAQLGL